jgi:hypothetical protein
MAPILTTTSGVTPQVLDDTDLIELLKSLHELPIVSLNEVCSHDVPLDIEKLCVVLHPWHTEWAFEEQVCAWLLPFVVYGSRFNSFSVN